MDGVGTQYFTTLMLLHPERAPVWQEIWLAADEMDVDCSRDLVHVRSGVGIDRRYDLHSRADFVPAPRLAGSGAASPTAVCSALLLGESPGEEMAELAARHHLFRRDDLAGAGPAGAQSVRGSCSAKFFKPVDAARRNAQSCRLGSSGNWSNYSCSPSPAAVICDLVPPDFVGNDRGVQRKLMEAVTSYCRGQFRDDATVVVLAVQ